MKKRKLDETCASEVETCALGGDARALGLLHELNEICRDSGKSFIEMESDDMYNNGIVSEDLTDILNKLSRYSLDEDFEAELVSEKRRMRRDGKKESDVLNLCGKLTASYEYDQEDSFKLFDSIEYHDWFLVLLYFFCVLNDFSMGEGYICHGFDHNNFAKLVWSVTFVSQKRSGNLNDLNHLWTSCVFFLNMSVFKLVYRPQTDTITDGKMLFKGICFFSAMRIRRNYVHPLLQYMIILKEFWDMKKTEIREPISDWKVFDRVTNHTGHSMCELTRFLFEEVGETLGETGRLSSRYSFYRDLHYVSTRRQIFGPRCALQKKSIESLDEWTRLYTRTAFLSLEAECEGWESTPCPIFVTRLCYQSTFLPNRYETLLDYPFSLVINKMMFSSVVKHVDNTVLSLANELFIKQCGKGENADIFKRIMYRHFFPVFSARLDDLRYKFFLKAIDPLPSSLGVLHSNFLARFVSALIGGVTVQDPEAMVMDLEGIDRRDRIHETKSSVSLKHVLREE